MGFLFVRRSRYEALRNDLWQCQVALSSKSIEAEGHKEDADAFLRDLMEAVGRAESAEYKLSAIAKILSGETNLALMPDSESVLEGN